MKNIARMVLLAVFLVGVLALPSISQAQEPKAQRFAIWEIVAKPSTAAEFEAALKKEIELGPAYPWTAYSTDDGYYYFITPIENYAGIDGLFKMEADWTAKLGDKMQELMKSFAGTYEYYRFGVYRSLPDLSYSPSKARLKPEETKFLFWGFAYAEVGKEEELEDVFKQWVELYKSKNLGLGFVTSALEMGGEMPFYFWNMSGKSAADFWTEDEKATKKIGEKAQELWKKTQACMRKYEYKTGIPRPDLSFLPEAAK